MVDTQSPTITETLANDALLELYRRMIVVRRFEELTGELYRDGVVPGFVHLSIGQEAAAVGACWPLRPSDVIVSNHRGHGHCLAKGVDPGAMFAELMGRDTGVCRGRGGSMHIADIELGVFGANGIVAAGLPIAVGAATSASILRDERVIVAFFGDGAVAQGAFHEAVNLAALWKLPVVFFCENNGYAEFSRAEDQHPVDLESRAGGYGLPFARIPGSDVEVVALTMTDFIASIRAGGGPMIVEAVTNRWRGHYEGDSQRYRQDEEVAAIERDDPLELARTRLLERGESQTSVDALRDEVEMQLVTAARWAAEQPKPLPETLRDFVFIEREFVAEPFPARGEPYRVMDAIRAALAAELDSDPTVFLAGVDVGVGGNIFALTRGLHERWPERVRDTPISETAIIGLAVGSALAGLRPVVELMYIDFLGVCFDQLLNQAAKLRYMTGGKARLPLTVRTQFGTADSSGSQHSQSLEALLAHIPGLTVVMPTDPADTYGLLRAAIRDPNPVIFIEHRGLYGLTGPRPPDDYIVPLGKAKVVRNGADITAVGASRMVHTLLAAADEIAADVDVEVIDVRTIAPLDRSTILESLGRTGRLLVAHEAVRDFGIGAEIAALAAESAFWSLDAPVRRLGGAPTPVPYAPSLEAAWLPDVSQVAATMLELAAE